MTLKSCLCLLLCVVSVTSLRAENWPNWRGPAHNGSSPEIGLPTEFGPDKSVLWKVELPGQSGSTPVIWDDFIFISSPDAKTKDLYAMCLSRKDGKVLWKNTVAEAADRKPQNGRNNMTSPSAVTDGKSVFFLYGTGDLVAYDFAGKTLWARNLQKDHGKFAIMWGYGSSPLLYKGKLYVPVMQRDKNTYDKSAPADAKVDSYLLAIDPATGKDLWKHIRPSDAKEETLEAYTTPVPFEHNGRSEILLTGADYVTGHNPETGQEYWRFGGWNPTKIGHWRIVVSPVASADTVYCAGPKGAPVYGVKAGGSGDISATHQAFKMTEFPPDVCTPVIYKNKLFVLDGGKRKITCLDPKTGEKKWDGALPGNQTYWVSPTAADDRIFCINEAGDVVVVSTGDEFKIVHTAAFGDKPCYSSIAIASQQLFIRTGGHLFCVGK